MLTEIRDKLGEAIAKGYGFNKFRDEIVPYLISKGWTGEDEKSIGHRVRTIWNTNQASANASSLWQTIQETKDKFPYLQYVGSISGEKREEHKPFYGLIAPVDDPIWQRIYPPNGYGCKCSVKQLTKGQAERLIEQQEKNGGRIIATDEAINKAVDKSFQHSPQALGGLPAYIEEKHGASVVNKLLKGVLDNPKGLATGEEWDIFREGANFVQKYATEFLSREYAKNPASILPDLFKKNGVKLGSISNTYAITDSIEIKTAMGLAVSFLPKNWVEECNKHGKIFLAEELKNKGEHFLLGTERAVRLKEEWNNALPHLGDFIAPQATDSWITIKISKFLVSDCTHEFSHRIQNFLPKLNQYYLDFYAKRTKNNELASLIYFP